MIINRDEYLNQLINAKNNNLIKVITGLRRSGKTYILFNLFKNHLIENAIDVKHIITFAFDNIKDLKLLQDFSNKSIYVENSKKIDPFIFNSFIESKIVDNNHYYILLDEIQELDNFSLFLNGYLNEQFDVYVTGSNSKMLSKDIVTEFRGRSYQIHVYPLSFKEFFYAKNLSFDEAYKEYQFYGGMPYCLQLSNDEDKQKYLKNLFSEIYIKDIVDRNKLENIISFEKLFKLLSSSIGSYTNPTNIEKCFKENEKIVYNHLTIQKHIDYIKDSFILSEALRYDIKGKKYIGANSKYYFQDIGLRNALLNFRQIEPSHIMENIIYNELIRREMNVDVGIVEINEKKDNKYIRKQLEVDFICNEIDKRIYIQSAYTIEDAEKLIQEKRSLLNIKDNFKKIIIIKDDIKKYYSEEGIEIISLKDFLLNDNYNLLH